ncbi:Acyl transferase 4 [Camellia lanceoleosa]|uniref:Acyl transferase 4 n=1 Tax=Camellia lanceoleosa TaxID=1840588 RepID=A0ACC0F287_9ERIC|nr:Acyl transferase 4 [Camellia lanceoleosa]
MDDLSVIRSSRNLVRPATRDTPTGMLELSVIDRLPVLRCYARTLHVYRDGPRARAAQVIKEALAKALVPYYPLAGRLHQGQGQGDHHHYQLQIACCGEGVWFVEASANCTLDALNYFDNVSARHHIPYDKLLPDPPPQTHTQTAQGDSVVEPLVLMQVTQFECDGFVIGLTFCHSICDGLGAAQFLKAVGELARGLEHLSVAPVWQRDFLPPRPRPSSPSPSPPQEKQEQVQRELLSPIKYQLEHANIDISLDQINELKQKFHESTGQTCSAFEIVAAIMWKNRTMVAINLEKEEEEENDKEDDDDDEKNTKEEQVVKLVFFANCRQLLQPPLPEGFYGNCFFPVAVTASRNTLSRASNAHVVKMIQEAKANLPNAFRNWTNKNKDGGSGDENDGEGDPFTPPLAYTTLFISEWGRLGFNQVDYGWGPPVHVVPVQGSTIIPVGIMGSLPSPKKGIRLMTWCVQNPHLHPFLHQMSLSVSPSNKLIN